jgi:solute carrier family 12 (potassium/chloride transporters), member 9
MLADFNADTLILQLGYILNTVPAWKRTCKLRVIVFVEYESDVEEERGRVKILLDNLRIEAEVLVFWLASGDLPTYEVIINGQSPGLDAEKEVDKCLKDQEWWEEIQKIRGKRGGPTASEELADVASILRTAPSRPETSFQQGPRHERVGRFLGLRRLLRKPKRRHTMSGITKLGVSLGMRTNRLYPQLMDGHPTNASASEDSESSSGEGDSDSDVFENDSDDQGREIAASEGDADDFESDDDHQHMGPAKLTRRRSHGDSLRGPPPSKKSTGEREPKVPGTPPKRPSIAASITSPTFNTAETEARPRSADTVASKPVSIPNVTNERTTLSKPPVVPNKIPLPTSPTSTPKRLEDQFSALRPCSASSASPRPPLSRHSSMPKFSSKPVPMTHVATEDGPGPSIMFADTPSPPRRSRLPSAYKSHGGSAPSSTIPDHISEASEQSPSRMPAIPPHGSTYSLQSIPLSFNDLPSRAQHLILNELIRQNSANTAVMFTTLPSLLEGTGRSEEASIAYLSNLEVLCRACPPCLLVHSNSMTVTMSL